MTTPGLEAEARHGAATDSWLRQYATAYAVNPKLAFRVWQREGTLYRRIWPSTILSTLMDPVLYLLALGFGLGAYLQEGFEGVTYLQFIAPGLVASSVMYAAAFEAAWNTFVRIYVERAYDSMLATPADLPEVVAGEYAWGATRAFIYSIVMLMVLAAFGLVQSWWALLVPFVAVLSGFLFMAIGMSYSVRCRHMDQLTFMFTLGVTPMFLFSGIFFPLGGLPAFVQQVAWLSPLYHMVEVMRDLVLGTVAVGPLLGHVAWMGVVTLAFWGLPTVALRRRLRS